MQKLLCISQKSWTLSWMPSVMVVGSGGYNSILQTGWLKTMNIYFSPFWRLVSPKSRYRQIWCPARTCLFVPKWWCVHWVLMWWKGEGISLQISCIRTLIPFIWAPLSWPKPLPKTSPPNAIHEALGFNLWIWGGGTTFRLKQMGLFSLAGI